MAKQNVLEMLKKPIQRSASSLSGLEHAAELISEFHRLLAEKDEEIRALHETIRWLRKEYEGSSRKGIQLPELVIEIAQRDMNGAIKTAIAKPRNV